MMKIGIVIPTRGHERETFLEFAKQQIKKQTRQPDVVEIVDFVPANDVPDITQRYRIGCEKIRRQCDVIVFWEDDDYYSPGYIERIESEFNRDNIELVGIDSTVYYNIFTRRFVELKHPGRASMMSTAIRTSALNKLLWPVDSYKWTDLFLWQRTPGVSKRTIRVDRPICIGIKHGIGLCGGGGHVRDWAKFDQYDPKYSYLEANTDIDAVRFYSGITIETKSMCLTPTPFLTIITRHMLNKRNGMFEKHMASVCRLNSCNYEHLFIIDRHGCGMLNANRSFEHAKPKGEFVHLADDDDFYTDPEFANRLFEHKSADVIMFKNKILTGDGDQIYPKPQSWKSLAPRRGQIGGSCFAVRRWVFEKYIHHFGHVSFGDWHFITNVLSEPGINVRYIDRVMFETGRVSHGAVE